MDVTTTTAAHDYIIVNDCFEFKWAVLFQLFDKILKFFQTIFGF